MAERVKSTSLDEVFQRSTVQRFFVFLTEIQEVSIPLFSAVFDYLTCNSQTHAFVTQMPQANTTITAVW